MGEIVRPEFTPDPESDRDEMETLQREIADRAVFSDDFAFEPAAVGGGNATLGSEQSSEPPLVAGVDQAFLDDRAISAIVVQRGEQVIERTYAVTDLSIPYIPGLLAFREGGPILDAVRTLDHDPDLYLFDGSGRIHYRQAGIATHMGVLLDNPAVGVAKSLLCGDPRESVDERPAGWRTAIESGDRVEAPAGTVIGYALQSRQYESSPIINPLYVSSGHRVGTETSADLVERLCDGYKLPEPTRLADSYADEVKSEIVSAE